jgi:hypothetical protein
MDWSNLLKETTGDAYEFEMGFERRHTEMLVENQSITNFLKAFQLLSIRKVTSSNTVVVLPRGVEGEHEGYWTLLEIANLPVMDVWRMDLSSADVVKFEWIGPIGRERDLVGLIQPPSKITINPRRLMMECWTAREGFLQSTVKKAATNAKAFGIGSSTERVRGTDEAPARGAIGESGERSDIPAALLEHMGTDQGKWMSLYNDTMQAQLAKITAYQTVERSPRGEVSVVDRKVEEVTQEYRIRTLDGTTVVMNTKNDSQKRVEALQGYIRCVSLERFQHFVRDGAFRTHTHHRVIRTSMMDSANMESAPGFDELERLPTVCDLPLFEDAGTIEKFVKLSFWFLTDYSGFHLRWFLLKTDGRPSWDETVSRQGKAALATAMARLETCLVVLLSKEFAGCLSSIQKIVSTDYAHFSDGYLRHYLEAMIARWSSDVHSSIRPSVEAYKDWSMKDPEACATLLKKYAEDFIQRAEQGWRSTERHLAPFTAHPHSLFFNSQGPFYNMKNQEGPVWVSPEPQVHMTGGSGSLCGGGAFGTSSTTVPGTATTTGGSPTGRSNGRGRQERGNSHTSLHVGNGGDHGGMHEGWR